MYIMCYEYGTRDNDLYQIKEYTFGKNQNYVEQNKDGATEKSEGGPKASKVRIVMLYIDHFYLFFSGVFMIV
jgi:hypothetical protein